MKIHTSAALVLGLLAALPASSAPINVPVSRIVIVDMGAKNEQAELKKHLDLLTGRDIPIVKPGTFMKSQFGFFLGRKPASTAETSLADLEALDEAEDSAAVARQQMQDRTDAAKAGRTPGLVEWKADKGGVYVWGELRRGLYRFLAEEFDFEWPWYDAIWVKRQTKTLTFRKGEGSWIPPFALRSIRARQNETFENWSKRLTAGKDNPPPEGHAFTSWWFRFCDDHREFFGQRPDGERAPYSVSKAALADAMKVPKKWAEYIPLCVSCEGLVDKIVADWKAAGAGRNLNFCENDARPWQYCRCKDCMALDATEPIKSFGGFGVAPDSWPGWRSDRYIDFARRILAKASKINPKVRGGMYAYNISELPPQREKVPENLVVGLVPTHFTKEYITAYIDGWKKAGLKEFYYRPNIRYYYHIPFIPCGFEEDMFDIQKILYDRGGCVGFNYDGHAASSYFEYVQCWYLFKFMYDPTKDFAYWNGRFCRCFGAAAPEVSDYFAYWRAKWQAEGVSRLPKMDGIEFRGRFYDKIANMYKEEDWVQTSAMLDKGLAKTGLSDIERKLLQDLRDENEQSHLFFLAWTKPTKESVADLITFRRTHNRATIWGYEEKAFGKLLPKGVGGGGKGGSHFNVSATAESKDEPVRPASDNVEITLDEEGR